MTEDEAKTKWCPMVRHESPEDEGNGTWNRGRKDDVINSDRPNYSCACIGSACMMWRSQADGVRDSNGAFVSEHEIARMDDDEVDKLIFIKQGYCGLAGKP